MATHSGGKKPPAKTVKQKKAASLKDNFEDRKMAKSDSLPPQQKSARVKGWTVVFVLLLVLAVASWGMWRLVPATHGFVETFFPIGTPLGKMADTGKTPTIEAAAVPPDVIASGFDDIDRRMAGLEAGLSALENRPAVDVPDPIMARSLESLETEIAALREHVVGLETRLKRAELPDEGGWALVVAAGELRAALRAARPFSAELAALRKTVAALGVGDGSLNEALAALDPFAEDGISTLESLGVELNGLAPRVVAAHTHETAVLKGDSWIAALRARLGSLISIRRTGAGVLGTTAEAVMARTEVALAAGDLKTAVAEVETLQGDSAHLAAPWLAGARARLIAEKSMATLSLRVTAILTPPSPRKPSTGPQGDGE
jgi:Na+-transporting methylmalonyl-CoA/oxaloacetate decarboxylase gamma subunit